LKQAARREGKDLARLKNALKDKRLVIIVGAGVTLSATADKKGIPLQRLTWTGLIRNGLEYLIAERYMDTSNPRTNQAYEALKNTDTDSLLDAANILSSQLTQHGQFPTWLETVFGNLDQEIRHPAILEVLKALHEKGATLLTTNYDDLLEKACNVRRIGRSNRDDILRFRRDLKGIFHVHGSYQDPDEVVLDSKDYYRIRESDEVQNLLKSFLDDRTILFVGCGSGLEDPNFDALLKWASERHKNLPNIHCLLIRNEDTLDYRPLVRLKYGASYQDLVPYLYRLLDDPSPQACIVNRTSTYPGRNQSILPFGRDEDFVGREEIIKKIEQVFSESQSLRRVALEGLGGVGYAVFSVMTSSLSNLKQEIPNRN
jgi:NAD-dependent SIR2 family protein deacetylase